MFTICPLCGQRSYIENMGGCAHCQDLVTTYREEEVTHGDYTQTVIRGDTERVAKDKVTKSMAAQEES